MKKNNAFRRAAALMAALSITVSLAAPAFADTYYIDYGDITITKNEDGSQTIQQGTEKWTDKAGEETVITTSNTVITTLESDLEGPAAEDTDFGPVVEDNYQPAQPEDAEKPEGADQPESAEEPKSADQHESADQQAAPAAIPAGATPVNGKGNGVFGNTITLKTIADKVLNLTLKDVKIDVSGEGKAALSVQGKGNAEIELDGDNELKSGVNRAGLEKTSTGKLTLKDDNNKAGSLTATGGDSGAGIGGGQDGNGKNITIKGGTVTATGGKWGAGIGGGKGSSGENITINGGTVTATGGYDGAGIGGGSGVYRGGDAGSGKNITINGGTVNAAGGTYGAGIGGGEGGNGENITITGGTVNATGGANGGGSGAGIGGGSSTGNGENITITGGTVNATGGEYSAGIGGSSSGNGKNITINGGTVNAAGGTYGAGIGGGDRSNGEDITINGGEINATGGKYGAGIGGGAAIDNGGDGKNITINGGTVNAAGGESGAGIGGGLRGSGSKVTVSGAAQVTTTAGKRDNRFGAGATIGNGGKKDHSGPVDGDEIQAKIDDLTTGYIHHISKNPDGSVKKEWWERKWVELEPSQPNPGGSGGSGTPGGPSAPAEEGNEVNLGTPFLHVETLKGAPLPFNIRQQGSTLRVTTDNLSARLHGTRQALETLQEQGVEQIQFVTTLKTTTLPVADLLAEGGSWFALEHDGLGSRRLSAAQAESLKCWRH